MQPAIPLPAWRTGPARTRTPVHPEHRWHRACLALLWLLACLLPLNGGASELKLLVLPSGTSKPYRDFYAEFRRGLPQDIHLELQEDANAYPGKDEDYDLIVPVGVRATEIALSRSTRPVLAVMVPSQAYEKMTRQHPPRNQAAAIYIDQPLGRRVNLLRAAVPDKKRIGVLYSSEYNLDTSRLQKLLSGYDAKLITQIIGPDFTLYESLEQVLSNCDLLLAVPDGNIYNSTNISNILLSSYRFGVPMAGLSKSLVDAGALLAVYSSTQDIATQAGMMVIDFSHNPKLPQSSYPDRYTVSVNRQVARSLGIILPPDESLLDNLRKLERTRNEAN